MTGRRTRFHGRRLTAAALAAALMVGVFAAPTPAARPRLAAYRGVAAWVDIYDGKGWENPEAAIAAIAQSGARTLFLQTCNYRCKPDLNRPDRLSRWIEAAHAQGMRIVAWYLPSFENQRKDFRRSMAAIRFRSASGQRFDSFALDIESRNVTPVETRNARMLALSKRIRIGAGRRYVLGAITPPWFYEWGGEFPYAGLDRYYDVFVPMIYFGKRAFNGEGARMHTATNIQEIRNGTGNPGTPVHPIAGIANDLNDEEVRAFVAAAKENGASGVSLYDYYTSDVEDWNALASWG
ncbi:MAG TPA: hypothetical protein VG602_05720 [Actinomycetota bacterium]|nr:hypothetical protein [Actinomycetota bacterium]